MTFEKIYLNTFAWSFFHCNNTESTRQKRKHFISCWKVFQCYCILDRYGGMQRVLHTILGFMLIGYAIGNLNGTSVNIYVPVQLHLCVLCLLWCETSLRNFLLAQRQLWKSIRGSKETLKSSCFSSFLAFGFVLNFIWYANRENQVMEQKIHWKKFKAIKYESVEDTYLIVKFDCQSIQAFKHI